MVGANLRDTELLKGWVGARLDERKADAARKNLKKFCDRWEVIGWRMSLLHDALDHMAHIVGHVRGAEQQREATKDALEKMKATLTVWAEQTACARLWLGLGPEDVARQIILD